MDAQLPQPALALGSEQGNMRIRLFCEAWKVKEKMAQLKNRCHQDKTRKLQEALQLRRKSCFHMPDTGLGASRG
jgi:hypothetical protein